VNIESAKKMDCNKNELMVVSASREIQDRNIVFVGIGLPVLGCLLAQKIRTPNITMIFESGVIDAKPSRMPLTMGDPSIASGAAMIVDFFDLYALMLQRGYIDVGFLGAAQIDKFGNLNTSVIGDYSSPKVRLPGSGGACEVASLSKKVIVVMPLDKKRFVERVDFITSPGHRIDKMAKDIRGGGPSAVITTHGIFRFDERGEMYLDSVSPGIREQDILDNVGWKINVASDVKEIPSPTSEELRVLREEIDPMGVFLSKGSD
jgi:glutaconate CoA-transferase, subunit B